MQVFILAQILLVNIMVKQGMWEKLNVYHYHPIINDIDCYKSNKKNSE